MGKPRKGSLAAAAAELRAVEAVGGPVVTPKVEAAIWHVDQSLPVPEKLAAEAQAQEQAGGGYERVVELSRQIVEAGLSFADIGPEDVEPPAEWVKKLGAKEALRKFRMTRAAWQPTRDAPAAIGIAVDVLKMDARVKAASKGAVAPQLNIAIQMNLSPQKYAEIEEDAD